ncbi:MAG: beta-ketoacyl-[acyl-carrier-protein] synthase II [Flavobacterium sp.]|uniref:beta-ketoacyl-ACP synthase II n=1 Tax=Flavobacterium sp. TaxID=239 RepID=UPI0012068BAD|nr:beta-ketoacyl-ACP synthase II [Flavobacterium sp.]RZJ65918.1 MAG: beta-ketoacyl-[acyl-carrier-protein] synthase II [Flavobacterium sp.]
MKRVVITGLGAITPLGNSVPEFWKNIIAGKSGAGPITKFDTTLFKTKFAHEVKDFNAENYFDRKDVRKYDPFTQYAVAASDEAIRDSGIDFANLSDGERAEVGVIWASGNGGITTFEQQLSEFHAGDGTPRFNPFFIPKMIVDIAAGVISIKHKLYGPNYATVSACASSNTAIISAFDTIRLGKASMMIAGGSEAAITPSSIGGFSASQALSKNNENPTKASRPFDADRDGFVAGEGAGALILEEYEHAKARGAKIYAEMVGGGMAADAYHLTGTSPDGLGAKLGMLKALADAGLEPSRIGSINAHATSTPQGDLSELSAIKSVFGNHPVLITATKSMTGHLLGAAGAIESIISVLSLKNAIVPPTINLENPDRAIPEGLQIVSKTARKFDHEFIMNNTFGFGGHTATAIFRKI